MKIVKFVSFILLLSVVAAGLPAVDLPVECAKCGHCGRSDHFPAQLEWFTLGQKYLEPMPLTVTETTHCSLCRSPEQAPREESYTSVDGAMKYLSIIVGGISGGNLILSSNHDPRFHRESEDHTSFQSFHLLC